MENCIFCKIAHDEVPTRKTHHEDGQVVSFLDINQRVPGHTLVVPVEHYRWFYELPDDLYVRLFRAARNLSLELKKEYNADYVQLAVVGEAVPHVHVHLLPRKLTDKVVL